VALAPVVTAAVLAAAALLVAAVSQAPVVSRAAAPVAKAARLAPAARVALAERPASVVLAAKAERPASVVLAAKVEPLALAARAELVAKVAPVAKVVRRDPAEARTACRGRSTSSASRLLLLPPRSPQGTASRSRSASSAGTDKQKCRLIGLRQKRGPIGWRALVECGALAALEYPVSYAHLVNVDRHQAIPRLGGVRA